MLLSALMGHTRIPVSCFQMFGFLKGQDFHLSNSMHEIWAMLSTKQNLTSSLKKYFRSIISRYLQLPVAEDPHNPSNHNDMLVDSERWGYNCSWNLLKQKDAKSTEQREIGKSRGI